MANARASCRRSRSGPRGPTPPRGRRPGQGRGRLGLAGPRSHHYQACVRRLHSLVSDIENDSQVNIRLGMARRSRKSAYRGLALPARARLTPSGAPCWTRSRPPAAASRQSSSSSGLGAVPQARPGHDLPDARAAAPDRVAARSLGRGPPGVRPLLPEHHHHLVCLSCGTVEDTELCATPSQRALTRGTASRPSRTSSRSTGPARTASDLDRDPAAGLVVVSTFLGGMVALRLHRELTTLIALTGGVVLGVAIFDVLPEAIETVDDSALVVGTLVGAGSSSSSSPSGCSSSTIAMSPSRPRARAGGRPGRRRALRAQLRRRPGNRACVRPGTTTGCSCSSPSSRTTSRTG